MNFRRAPEGHYFATGENFYYEIHKGQQFWKAYCRRGTHNPLKMIGGYGRSGSVLSAQEDTTQAYERAVERSPDGVVGAG